MPIALVFPISKFESNSQTNNRLVLLFVSTTEEFSTHTPPRTPPRTPHTHKKHTQKRRNISHSTFTLKLKRRNFRTRKTKKPTNSLSHDTLLFVSTTESIFKHPHQQRRSTFVQLCRNFQVSQSCGLCCFLGFFLSTFCFDLIKANMCSSNQFFFLFSVVLSGVVFVSICRCFVFYFLFQLHRNFRPNPIFILLLVFVFLKRENFRTTN